MALEVVCLLKYVFLEPFLDCFSASTPKKRAKRGPKPKQIGTSDYCRTCGCFVYLNSTGHSSLSLKATENLFFLECSSRRYKLADDFRDLGFTVSQTEDQASRFCSHCSNQVRSTRAVFFLFKPAVKKASMTVIAFGF